MTNHVNVTYTAYEKGTSNVMSEGTIPVPGGTNCWVAENTVRAMFNGLEVIIRSSTPVIGS
jgi:hypothetical protein